MEPPRRQECPGWHLGAFFARGLSQTDRAQVRRGLRGGWPSAELLASVSPDAARRIRMAYDDIRGNQAHTYPFPGVFGDAEVFREHARIQVLESTDPHVDLIEAYWCTLLGALQLEPLFVDSWFQHISQGEIHCAMNAIRTPRELDSPGREWWDSDCYDPERDLRYDPAR